jgi:hypothetical protein
MKRARVKEAALAVLLREGFDQELAERLADLIAHEPIPSGRPEPDRLGKLEKTLERVKESH